MTNISLTKVKNIPEIPENHAVCKILVKVKTIIVKMYILDGHAYTTIYLKLRHQSHDAVEKIWD